MVSHFRCNAGRGSVPRLAATPYLYTLGERDCGYLHLQELAAKVSELSDRVTAAIAKIKDANRKLEVRGVLALLSDSQSASHRHGAACDPPRASTIVSAVCKLHNPSRQARKRRATTGLHCTAPGVLKYGPSS